MMFSSPPPLISLFYLFLIVSPPFDLAAPPFRVKLLHVDNSASPFRLSYHSVEHKYQEWEKMSHERASQIIEASEWEGSEKPYHPNLTVIVPYGVFLAKMGIGIPPQEQYLLLDTGSTITWVNCTSPKYKQLDYSFPLSSNGSKIYCNDYQCKWIPYRRCKLDSVNKPCSFMFTYYSTGIISGDMLADSFSVMDKPTMSTLVATHVAFGCVKRDHPLFSGFTGTGVAGLSTGQASLASQLGPSFSYCFGNIYNESSPYNSLTLGRGDLLGKSTPILDIPNRIYVTIESIKVGEEILPLDPYMFRRYGYVGGTVMDTGSTTTYLLDEAYQAVRNTLKKYMQPLNDAFCFGYPHRVQVVQIIFEGGAVLSLGAEALFGSLNAGRRPYCLEGIKSTSSAFGDDSKFMSVIGINAQQHHNIGFDLTNKRMYIQESSCDYEETN